MTPQAGQVGAARRPHFRFVIVALSAGAVALTVSAGSARAQHHHRHHHHATVHRERAAQASPGVSAPHPAPPDDLGQKRGKRGDSGHSGSAVVHKSRGGKEKVFNFTGFELSGSVRMPQLFYFLDRAQEELQRASLERRSFVPDMVKSVDEENL